jgi:hypothetical protein
LRARLVGALGTQAQRRTATCPGVWRTRRGRPTARAPGPGCVFGVCPLGITEREKPAREATAPAPGRPDATVGGGEEHE